MTKKNFLLLSLEDNKAKKIANIISNGSCKKILDYLAQEDATETQIVNKLKLPASTVHYNLKQLLDTKLIDWEEAHYSEKGKQVKHYTLANKYIIIAPKHDKSSIADILKSLIPTTLLTILGAGALYIFPKLDFGVGQFSAKSTEMIAMDTQVEMLRAAPMTAQIVQESLLQTIINSNITWFLIGAIFSLTIYIIINKLRKR